MTERTRRDVVADAIRQAGDAVRRVAEAAGEDGAKVTGDPVARAEREAEPLLYQPLLDREADAGWLTHVTRGDSARLGRSRVWIVNLFDGARQFHQGVPVFALSVALVEADEPILSAIYNPMTDELFQAERGQGATRNGEPIRVRTPSETLEIVTDHTDIAHGKLERIEQHCTLGFCGSVAYKMAQVADGRYDGTFRVAPLFEWHVAAGALLVTEAGGVAYDAEGYEFRFNQGDPEVRGMVAASEGAYPSLRQILNDVKAWT